MLAASCDPSPTDGPVPAAASRALESDEPSGSAGGFAGLSPGLFSRSDVELARPEVLERFRVDRDTARRWAVGWLAQRAELAGPAHVCFELPWLDAAGEVVAHQFVLTDLPDCGGWSDLLGHARALADGARMPAFVGAESADAGELRARTTRSARHFFTLAVSAWSFRHPLRDGVKGLPFWLIAFDRLPAEVLVRQSVPTALYPLGNAGGLVEALDYRAGGERLLFSHHAARAVDPGELRWRFDAAAALRNWRDVGRLRHADDPAGWCARHAALWRDELEGGAP